MEKSARANPAETHRVYIASPYTIGDCAANVRAQHDAFAALLALGHMPFAPLLSHYQQLIHPVSWEEWLKWDFAWLAQCDLVLRLPGESRGADLECARAKELSIPVVETKDQAIHHLAKDVIAQRDVLREMFQLLEAVTHES